MLAGQITAGILPEPLFGRSKGQRCFCTCSARYAQHVATQRRFVCRARWWHDLHFRAVGARLFCQNAADDIHANPSKELRQPCTSPYKRAASTRWGLGAAPGPFPSFAALTPRQHEQIRKLLPLCTESAFPGPSAGQTASENFGIPKCSQGSSQLREQAGRTVKLTASNRPNTELRVHFRPSPFGPATSDPSTIRVCGTQKTVTKAMAVHCLELYLVGSSTGCCTPTKWNDARSRSSKNEG